MAKVALMIGGPLHMRKMPLAVRGQDEVHAALQMPVSVQPEDAVPQAIRVRRVVYTRRNWFGQTVFVPRQMTCAQALELVLTEVFR